MNLYYVAAIWLGMALLASVVSIRIVVPVALVEIVVGALAGNIPGIKEHVQQTSYTTFLASIGSVLLTFLAGAEIDPVSLRKHWRASVSIGVVSFLLPFVGAFAVCRWGLHWHLHAAEIGGIALSTTSVAVVYAVMVETGLNRQDIGKLILAACFVTDLGTVLALGGFFAQYGWLFVLFAVVTPGSATASASRRSSSSSWCCSPWGDWPPRRGARPCSRPMWRGSSSPGCSSTTVSSWTGCAPSRSPC